MVIIKEHLRTCLAELDEYHQRLRSLVEGVAPNPNTCLNYNCETQQFQRDYTDVDLDALDLAIAHFNVAVNGLKTVKKRVAKANSRP